MAWQMRSRARWEETLNIQKRRLGKKLKDVDTKLSFDTFNLYVKDLEHRRSKYGLGRIFKPDVLDQIKDFTAAVNSFSQASDVTCILWGSIQTILKVAYAFTDTMGIIAEMISDMTQQLPLFDEYQSIFPVAYELDDILRELYMNYVGFCINAVLFLKSKKWKFLMRLTFGNLQRDFGKTQLKIAKNVTHFQARVDIARTRLGVRAHQHIISLSKANMRQQTSVNGIPFHRNYGFQGRDASLDVLHQKLRPRSTAKSGNVQGQTSCVIQGIGGVGKTQVALEYTYKYREDYAYIFWVRSENSIELTTFFASFARTLVPDRAVQDQMANVQLVKDWMVQNDRWLLVFDNADDANVDLTLYWPPSAHGAIIITTQRRELSHWAVSSLRLDTFDEHEGAKLILDVVDQTSQPHSPEAIKMAEDISIELGGLPLLLSHVAGYVEATKAPLSIVLENLKQPSMFNKIWRFDLTASTNFQYREPMTKVWRLALDSLKPEALRVLQIMAMLSPDEISEDMLFGQWQDSDLDFLNENKRFEFNEIRQSLIDRHLVTATVTPLSKTKLSIHRVLKRHVLQLINDQGSQTLSRIFGNAVAMVRFAFPKADALQTPTSDVAIECETCLPHVLSLMRVFQDWAPKVKPNLEFATLLADTGTNYMWERGLSVDAMAVLTAGEGVCGALSHLDEISDVHADLCAIAGSVYETVGLSGRETALEKCEKALDLRSQKMKQLEEGGKKISTPAYLQLANAWNDVGVVKLSFGNFTEALPYFLESDRLKREHSTEDSLPWHHGETYKNLSLVKLFQGDHEGAERDARRSWELCRRGRIEKDASTQKAHSILGVVLMNINKPEEALRLQKGVYEMRHTMFGETNLHTKNSLYLVAELYRLKNKMEKAEKNFRLVLSNSELCWSEEARARAQYHLGLTIKAIPRSLDTARDVEAETYMDGARRTRRKIIPTFKDDPTPAEELQSFDFMVSLLAGRWISPPAA